MKNLNVILATTFLSFPVWKLLLASWFSLGKLSTFGPILGRQIERLKQKGFRPLSAFPVNEAQKRRELPFIVSTSVIAVGSVFFNAWMADLGLSRIYSSPGQHSLVWFVLQPLALLLLADVFFYAIHAFMHSRLAYRRVHLIHHRSVSLRTLSTGSLHPFEAILQNLIFSGIALIVPIQEAMLIVVSLALTGYNFYLHAGVELFPKSYVSGILGRIFTSSTYHHMHHARGSVNLGVYTRILDRIFGTEAADYEEQFLRNAQEDGPLTIRTRQTIRATGLILLVIGWALALLVLSPLSALAPAFTQRRLQGPLLKLVTSSALKLIGFRIHIRGELPEVKGSLIVANHVSYLDIPVLASLFSTSFITTVETVSMPLLGSLIRRAGCIVIERRSRTNLPAEMASVESAIDAGVNVMFFPESKATDGSELLIFRRPFFQPACRRNRPVIALTVNYLKVGDETLNLQNRDRVYWYRQNPLGAHILSLLKEKSVELEVFFEVVHARSEESSERPESALAERARKVVARNWRGVEGSRAQLYVPRESVGLSRAPRPYRQPEDGSSDSPVPHARDEFLQ